ncbi:branched-chain amino acid ABC transporter substrate-binding protein, partial [Bacillus cereus]
AYKTTMNKEEGLSLPLLFCYRTVPVKP